MQREFARHITDNASIPLKDRVVDYFYNHVRWFLRKLGIKVTSG